MPKYTVQSPSGQTLTIDGDAPPTEKELDEIFARMAPADTKAPVAGESVPSTQSEKGIVPRLLEGMTANQVSINKSFDEVPDRLGELASLPGKIYDKLKVDAEALKAKGWENLTPKERMDLTAMSIPRYLGEEIVGKGEGVAERSIPPAVGQFIGRILPGGPRVWGALGGIGGEITAEIREGQPISPGKVTSAGIRGATTGRPLAGAGVSEVGREAAKFAGSELAGVGAESAFEGKLPDVGETIVRVGSAAAGAPASKLLEVAPLNRRYLEEMRDQTFKDVRKWGIVVPPHELGRGSDTVASFAGKTALHQESALRNQRGWQIAVREELGMPKEALPITRDDLRSLRRKESAPYREIESIKADADNRIADLQGQIDRRMSEISKIGDAHEAEIQTAKLAKEVAPLTKQIEELQALSAADVRALQIVRDEAADARKRYFNGDTTAYEKWQTAKAEAEKIEGAIDRAATIAGDKDLLARLQESRKRIAQSYSVEDSLNRGNGYVDPVIFGRQYDQGVPLTGNLEKIAKFQQAFNREAVEAGRVPAPGVGNVGAMATTAMASRGDIPGMLGAVSNATLGRVARPYLLSERVQQGLLKPDGQNFSAIVARLATQDAIQAAAGIEPEPVDYISR